MLVGDFNLPYISWRDSQSTTPVNNGGCANSEDLCELVGDNFLHQFIEGSTHRAGNKLDLLFCNNSEKICDVLTFSSDEHNFPTDHHIIKFKQQGNLFEHAQDKSAWTRGNCVCLREI